MRVAVIGAGASGLTAIKCCLDEDIEPVCFDRTSHLGGLWYYTEDVVDGQGSVAKTTVINTSKEVMCYSDFPIPKEFPNFMHNTKVVEYFQLYANQFDLERHIRFNTEVHKLSRAPDFQDTGRWALKIRDISTGNETMEVFDAVMLCTGHLASKHVARFEGDESFKGRVMHTSEFRDHRGFEDKTVVIVGIGNSGGDAAVDLSRISKQVFLSTRRGSWVTRRLGPGGLPFDCTVLNRVSADLMGLLPMKWKSSIVEASLGRQLDHEKYGLKPQHSFFSQHPLVNDDLPNRIACGTVVVKPDVKRLTERGVQFVDGSVVDDVDVILLATGYVFAFPFLEEGVIDVQDNKVELYKYVFPPELEHPTLAAIGFVQPLGAINPISELQSRWATRVFKKLQKLPSREEMWTDIREKRDAMARRYVASKRHTIQVDAVPYQDEIADIVGCKPAIGQLFKKDFKLACKLYFGPSTPYQYRLEGPGQWEGAREAIDTQWDRILYPLCGRPAADAGSGFPWKFICIAVLLAIVVVWIWM